MSPLPGLVLALLSLLAWTAAAQSSTERMVRVRRVLLSGAAVDVRVAPGIPTTLNFDADINPLSVTLGDEGRVTLLSVAARSITLTPEVELRQPVALRVRFADACIALEPRFSLRADATEVDAQLTVYRDARAPELLLARVAESEARAAACEAKLSALQEHGRTTGPASLVLSGQLGTKGVQVAEVRCHEDTSASGLSCFESWRFRAQTWLVVSTQLRNLPGQPAWRPGQAWLVNESSGERVAARVVALAPEALVPAAEGRLVVELARPPLRPGEVYRVEVQEAEGTRHLSLINVTVDGATKPASKRDEP